MALTPPDLDDRRFQDLVDDAKRMVQRRCPEWTDHNVSDPGVTLIETFAFMVDQLLYRLNRVPDRLYVTFLDLIGVTLHPPTAARADVTFWLSAPQTQQIDVPEGTEVSTPRGQDQEAVTFTTTSPLAIPPRELAHVAVQPSDGDPSLITDTLFSGAGFPCFSRPPRAGDALLVGLSDATPSGAIALRFDCELTGEGVDPRHPPLVWEAWIGGVWARCDVDRDETGGLNRPGDVVLHLPADHAASVVGRERAGWLRCRVVTPETGFPFYKNAPTVRSLSAFTVGGTAEAVHAETVRNETLGASEGVAGQRFRLSRAPVVAGSPAVTVEVAGADGWRVWHEVDSFADSSADSEVFRVDRSSGEIAFGPAVRLESGELRRHGAVPSKGAPVRVPSYRTGGGPAGNVAARTITVLRTTIPFLDRVDNRRPALGGVAGETVEEAKLRAPLTLRTRGRAVTAEDFEQLARAAAPGVARVRCVPAGDGAEAGGVRVLIVPSAAHDEDGRLRFADMVPSEEDLAAVTEQLDERRVVGTRLVVEPPFYQGVTVVARLTPPPRTQPNQLRDVAVTALHRYFDPLVGGPDGRGWPFGRPVQAGEVYAVLQRLPGTEIVEDVRLFAADPLTGRRGDPVQRIDLERHALVFSFDHQVRITAGS